MKKFIIGILTIALLFTVTACFNSNKQEYYQSNNKLESI